MKNISIFSQKLSNIQIAIILLLLGFLVYGNSLFNGFIADDVAQVKENPLVQNISNIPNIFTQGNFYDDSGQRNNYYKPILSTTILLIYSFSGENTFGYHLIQVLLHIVNTILIFLILRIFFRKGPSFLLSLLFLVHPINTEAVIYISALQENLFLFFGLISLFLTIKKPNNIYLNLFMPILLLLSLLSKETGIVFLFIIPMYKFLYQKRKLLISFLQDIVALSAYLFLRLEVAHISLHYILPVAPIQTISLGLRFFNIPKIIFFYLQTFFYPKSLIFFQTWIVKSLSFQDFYYPLLFDGIFFLTLLAIGIYLYQENRENFKVFIFFFTWLLVGLGVHLQIIPLDETVADRWFYFPIIGLLGIIGVVCSYLHVKTHLRLWLLFGVFVMIVSFLLRTIIRNTNWIDEASLYTHDIQFNHSSYQLEKALGIIEYDAGDTQGALKHYIKAVQLFPSQNTFSSLGYFYLQTNESKKAEAAYEKAVGYDKNFAISWGYLAVAKYKAGDKNGAITAAKKAYTISPSDTFSQILNAIENNKPIGIR
ncbi:MAG TPA: tetratricopeptide repeat protein [Patescibacteria group bacterium]|nr:tetratricopeptide repeat protein [Patescibacteria group bacterium]